MLSCTSKAFRRPENSDTNTSHSAYISKNLLTKKRMPLIFFNELMTHTGPFLITLSTH